MRISQMHSKNSFGAASTRWLGTRPTPPSSIGLSSLDLGFNVKDKGDFFTFRAAESMESDRCCAPNNVSFYDFLPFR
ncbi:hypothetical protein TNCV_44501 [Trichonephila clavipes]|nr:hypothetical protein TNCV_44501 [Trichonephila clavipes]